MSKYSFAFKKVEEGSYHSAIYRCNLCLALGSESRKFREGGFGQHIKMKHPELYHKLNNLERERKMYSLFIGRYQTADGMHGGHKALVKKVLDEGKPVLIAVRDTPKDEKNPFSATFIASKIEKYWSSTKHKDMVKVIIIPDITEVCYGRGVGWGVREIRLDEDTESISATKIRETSK